MQKDRTAPVKKDSGFDVLLPQSFAPLIYHPNRKTCLLLPLPISHPSTSALARKYSHACSNPQHSTRYTAG
jgi:hypothetical protein